MFNLLQGFRIFDTNALRRAQSKYKIYGNIFPIIRLCTKSSNKDVSEIVVKKRKKKGQKNENEEHPHLSEEMRKFFNTPEQTKQLLLFPPKMIRKKRKMPEHFYVFDTNTAQQISQYLLEDLNNLPLVEINPGSGLLTKLLLDADTRDLRLFETYAEFLPNLNDQFGENSNVRIKTGDIIGLWKLVYQDKCDEGSRVDDLLFGLPISNWEENVNFRLFAPVGSLNFIKHLINSVASQANIMSYGRCEMFLVVPPSIYIHLTCERDIGYLWYRSTTMLFQIMFEHTFITKLPKKHFLPWHFGAAEQKSAKLKKIHSIDKDSFYLIKIVPRKELFDLCPPHKLLALSYFIKQNCVSRKNRVIPTLEKWIPGCGVALLVNNLPSVPVEPLEKQSKTKVVPKFSTRATTMSTNDFYADLDIFTEFGDLSPSQMLTLFHQFVKLPEFSTCSFISSMESNILKIEPSINQTADDDLTEIIEEEE